METQTEGAGVVRTTGAPTYHLDGLTYFHLEILHDVLVRERTTIEKALAATRLPDDHRRVRDKANRRDRIAEILTQVDVHKSAHVARVKTQLAKPPFIGAEAPPPIRYTCVPKSESIGCGATFVGEPNKDGFLDCPYCGNCYPASEGKPVPWHGKLPARAMSSPKVSSDKPERMTLNGHLVTIIERNEEADGCELEGCRGHAVVVRAEDGTETMVCSQSIAAARTLGAAPTNSSRSHVLAIAP